MVSDEVVAEFAERGYVVVPGLLGEDELARYVEAVDAAVAHRTQRDGRALVDKSRYEQSFIQCINLWEDFPEVRALTFHPTVAAAAARLLGADSVRLWHDQALYKEAGGRETDGHQDLPYWPMAESDALTAWIPLEGSTLDGGAMGYWAGSHRLGVRRFVNIFFGEPEDLASSELLQGEEPTFVEVPAGSVAFHHSMTFHVARPNSTGRVRRVHTAIYFRHGCTRGSEFPHFAVDRARIPVGGTIESDVTPIAWPREEGDLPEPSDLPYRQLTPEEIRTWFRSPAR